MSRYKLISLTSFFLVFLFTQCHKCHDKELASMTFSQEDLNINPYKNSDSILFISSDKDTLQLKGERGTENESIQENGFNSDLWVNYKCKGQWYITQFDWTWFFSHNDALIKIQLELPDMFSSSYVKTIYLKCWNSDKLVGSFEGTYQYDKDSIRSLTTYHSNGFVEGYQHSLSLGQKTYYDVYKLHRDTTDYSMYIIPDMIDRVYYSISEGIVGFSLKSRKYYYLEKRF